MPKANGPKAILKARSLNEFQSLVNEIREEWDFDKDEVPRPWYRGHQRKHWKLVPGIFRLGHFDRETEDEIREEFAVRAPALSQHEALPTSVWDFYFLMQHYGAPTRLLDWTESPAIALYFAVRDNPGYYDSAVWVLDPYTLNQRVIKKGDVISPSAVGANPKDSARVAPWFPERWTKTTIPDLPLAIFPTHIARRISSQRSCFTIHGKLEAGFSRFLAGSRPCLKKIVIPAHVVNGIRLDLQNFGIDDTTIFPDLEGLGRALATSYREIKKDSPHRGTYVRLQPSKLGKAGVGIFAIARIPKGTRVFAGENEEVCWMDKGALPKSGPLRKLYDEFAIIKGDLYGCPTSFNRLTPAWFMKDSKKPNTRIDENYDFYTLREIAPGEELTVNFVTFSDNPA
jgi:FRG domain